MNLSSHQDNWSEDLQLPANHGFLKHDVLERICRYLPQQDCYQACLINRAWQYPASNVLWESPVFRTPSSFKTFLKIIVEKRLALNVRHLTLCLPDTPSSTLFEPINQSEQARHMFKDNSLSRSHVIDYVIQFCQQLVSLTVYGWNLEQYDFDKLRSFLPSLTNLKVIGTNDRFLQQSEQQKGLSAHSEQIVATFQLAPYLTRLHQLVLDGRFPISKSFASSIANKAQNLTTLHLSLYSMSPTILATLCTPNTGLDLKDLTLTHGVHMNDYYADKVLDRFPNLRKFRMEGAKHLTANVLRLAMENCQYLQHLEIRQTDFGAPLPAGKDQEDWQLPNENGGDIRTLLLENLHVYNGTLENLAYYCPLLTSLGLAHTGNDLTDIGIEAMAKASFGFLRHVHLSDCPMVTSEAIIYLSTPSLYTLYLESIGKVDPSDVYKICSQAVERANDNNLRPNLRQIQVVGHANVATSAVGTHAIERLDYQAKQWADETATLDDILQSSNYTVTLDQQAIDSLAHSDEFVVVPPSKFLTGQQIMELAKKLQLPLNNLVRMLDELKEQEPKNIMQAEEPKSRVDILKKKSTSQHLRPSTPALWAAAVNDPETLPPQKPNVPLSTSSTSYDQINSIGISSSSPQPKSESGATTPDTTSSQFQQSDDEYDQYEYDNQHHSDEKENWVDVQVGEPSTSTATGGWVTTDITPWSKKTTTSFDTVVAGSPSTKANKIVKICNTGNGNGGVEWGNSTEENYEYYWNPTPDKESQQSAQQVSRSSNTRTGVGSDQWGQANKFVSWKDTEPYVGDVLETQHKTIYWSQEKDGEWKTLHGGEQQSNDNTSLSNGRADIVTERRSIPAKFSTPITTKRQSTRPAPIEQVDHSNLLLNNSSPSSNTNDSGAKSYSLSSDGSDVDWDDDDGITIKINGTANVQQQARNASSARHLGKSSWKEKKDWGMPATGDRKPAQDSPMAAHGPGLAANNTTEGIKAKTNGREPRTTRFARPKTAPLASAPASVPSSAPTSTPTSAPAPTSSSAPAPTPAPTSSSAPAPTPASPAPSTTPTALTLTPSPAPLYTPIAVNTTSPKASATKLWQQFADNKKGNNPTTNAALSATSPMASDLMTINNGTEEEEMATELLVDTSDDTAVVGTTTWTPSEERPTLHDFYSSMADIQIGANSNSDTPEQEIVFWSDEAPQQNEHQDDRWTINKDQIKDVGQDDMLLLFEDLPTPESPSHKEDTDKRNVNGTTSTTPIKTSDDLFATSSLLSSNASTPKASGSAKATPTTMASFLDDHPPSTATNAIVDDAVSPTPDDILSSPITITNMSSTNEVSATPPTDSPSNDSPKATPTDSPNTNEPSNSALDSNNEDDWVMKLSLLTPNGQQELLLLYGTRDPKQDVHAFCERHDMLHSEEYIYENAKKKYLEKRANILLGGGSKKKKKKKKKEQSG